jgi:hypothetical protein
MKTLNTCLITSATLIVFTTSAHAFDSRKCNKMLNQGTWKTYQYTGLGEGQSSATSAGTRKSGSSNVSSTSSTESSTSAVDPQVTSHYGASSVQYLSSYGDCDSFALNNVREERDHFIVLNSVELKKEIALGQGQFLSVLDDYSLCSEDAIPELHQQLRQGFGTIVDQTPDNMPKAVMQVIGADPKLRSSCDTI